MTTKKLTIRQKLLVAGTLFGMFFLSLIPI